MSNLHIYQSPVHATYDFIVIGTGPAGAAAALPLCESGASVLMIDKGHYHDTTKDQLSGFNAMSRYYDHFGARTTRNATPMPIVQGSAIGGSTIVNGAISWQMPYDVYESWIQADRALGEQLSWDDLDAALQYTEASMGVTPTDPSIAGPNNLLLAKGAEALGIKHRPIRRYTQNCVGQGACLQGCPHGNKTSMERTILPQCVALGAHIVGGTTLLTIEHNYQRANGIKVRLPHGRVEHIDASQGVILAASAIHTPVLLQRSGLHMGPVGENFSCHPGVSIEAHFDEDVNVWSGATQGHEVIGLREQGLKFEALGYDKDIAAGRFMSLGRQFTDDLSQIGQTAHWGIAVKASARGRIRSFLGQPWITYKHTAQDIQRFRTGIATASRMALAAGAEYVIPGVLGQPARWDNETQISEFENNGPTRPSAYTCVATHLFGTAKMGTDPSNSVVRPDGRTHQLQGLYIVDSSIFPTNIGVNPQTSIMALARIIGQGIVNAASWNAI